MEIGKGWGRRKGGWCLRSTEVQFGMMEKFWKWIVVMVTRQCDVLNATEEYTLKRIS